MRKLIVVVSSLAVFSAGWCFGQAQHLAGGSDWKVLPRADHGVYLAGFLQGYWRGTVQGSMLAIEHNAPEKMPPMTPDTKNELTLARKVKGFLVDKNPSANDLEPTVSAFYGDYRNMPVCFGDAILLSAASLAGNAATEQELGAARKHGAESGCK